MVHVLAATTGKAVWNGILQGLNLIARLSFDSLVVCITLLVTALNQFNAGGNRPTITFIRGTLAPLKAACDISISGAATLGYERKTKHI